MAGLTLAQFWDHTPFELGLVVGGYNKRLRAYQEQLAWHVCYIVNCWSKRKIKPKQILPKESGKTIDVSNFATPEALATHIKKLREERKNNPLEEEP